MGFISRPYWPIFVFASCLAAMLAGGAWGVTVIFPAWRTSRGVLVMLLVAAAVISAGGWLWLEWRFRAAFRERLRVLTEQLCLAEEHERRRVAEGLHDEVGQLLGGLSMHLEAASGATLTQPQKESLSEARELLCQISRAVRTLTFELCPPMLYKSGLPAALDWLVKEYARKFPIRFDLTVDGNLPELSEPTKALVFRAAGELLNNAATHASPKHAQVRLTNEGGELKLCVEDDGAGFDPAKKGMDNEPGHGFGLFAISQRAQDLGGRVNVDSTPGIGSRITLSLPIKGCS